METTTCVKGTKVAFFVPPKRMEQGGRDTETNTDKNCNFLS